MPVTYDFGEFHLDAAERLLLRHGRPVSLPPKAFDLLLDLVQHAGHLREKKELMETLWPGTFVEEANLAYTVSTLRKALEDGHNGDRFIETVPTRGYRFIGDVVAKVPHDAAFEAPEGSPVAARRSPDLRRSLVYVSGLAAALLLGAATTWWLLGSRPGRDDRPGRVSRTMLEMSGDPMLLGTPPASNVVVEAPHLAVSADGRRVAYIGRSGDTTRLFLRDLGEAKFREIRGTEGAIDPFFSPDGRSIGFLTSHQVKKVGLDGSLPQVLCDAAEPVIGAWYDRQIFFSAYNSHRLFRIAEDGGTPVPLADPKEPWWLFTDVLPGGQ